MSMGKLDPGRSRRLAAAAAAILMALVGLAGCFGGDPPPDEEQDGTTSTGTGASRDLLALADLPEADLLTPEQLAAIRPGGELTAPGAPDGPPLDRRTDPPEFAQPARGFDPSLYEASLLPLDPVQDSGPQWDAARQPTGNQPPGFGEHLLGEPLPCPRAEFDQAALTVFDNLVEQAMAGSSIMTSNLAVSDECGLLYEQGYGFLGPRPWAPTWPQGFDPVAYVEHLTEPTGTDTMWKLASLTKPITSALIHKMVDGDIIDYDDTVFCPSSTQVTGPFIPAGNKCLLNYDPATGPGTIFTAVTPWKQQITVGHLLQHQSGYDRNGTRNGDFMFQMTAINDAVGGSLPPDHHDIVEYALSQPVYWQPGTTANALDRYSNYGFMLLGMIVEKWGGVRVVEGLELEVFSPMGVPAADVEPGRSISPWFNEREPYYPCGGKGATMFPGLTDPQVCSMYGRIVMEPQIAHGSLVTTAGAVALFMTHYWVDWWGALDKGQPRDDYWDFPNDQRGTHNGAYSGVKSIMVQCLNGLNFAWITNAGGGSSAFPYGEMTDGFCAAGDAFYDWGPYYSTIWYAGGDIDWTHRNDLTGAQHQAAFNTLTRAGYRLVDISCFDLNDETRYASAWAKTGGDWASYHDMDPDAYQDQVDLLWEERSAPVEITACDTPGGTVFAAIWEPFGDYDRAARHDQDHDAFQTTFTDFTEAGYRLIDRAGYEEDGVAKYASSWRKPIVVRGESAAPPEPAWVSRPGVDGEAYQDFFNEYTEGGLAPWDVTGFQVGDQVLFAGIWADVATGGWAAGHGIPHADFPSHVEAMRDAGFRLVNVSVS